MVVALFSFTLQPGLRARAAYQASWRAFHSRFRVSASRAHWKSEPPLLWAISSEQNKRAKWCWVTHCSITHPVNALFTFFQVVLGCNRALPVMLTQFNGFWRGHLLWNGRMKTAWTILLSIYFHLLKTHTGCADLLLKAALGAVELQEEGRSHGVGQRAESVARIHHHIIQELCRHNAQRESRRVRQQGAAPSKELYFQNSF